MIPLKRLETRAITECINTPKAPCQDIALIKKYGHAATCTDLNSYKYMYIIDP